MSKEVIEVPSTGLFEINDRLVSPSGETLATWINHGHVAAWKRPGSGLFMHGSLVEHVALGCGAKVLRDAPEPERQPKVWYGKVRRCLKRTDIWTWKHPSPSNTGTYQAKIWSQGTPEPLPKDVAQYLVDGGLAMPRSRAHKLCMKYRLLPKETG